MVRIPKAGLRPYSVIEEGLDQYLGYNFNRLENLFERTRDALAGNVTMTGLATITTGLAFVDNVVACLASVPSAAACFVTANPGSSSGTVDLRVYTNAFVDSTTPVTVRWVAIGELVLT